MELLLNGGESDGVVLGVHELEKLLVEVLLADTVGLAVHDGVNDDVTLEETDGCGVLLLVNEPLSVLVAV